MSVVARKTIINDTKSERSARRSRLDKPKTKERPDKVRPWSFVSSKSIYREKSFRWHEDPNETTYAPYVTSPRDFQSVYVDSNNYKTYFDDSKGLNEKGKPEVVCSLRPKQPSWVNAGVLRSEREAEVYANISSLYNSNKAKQKRQNEFVKKYVDFRLKFHKETLLQKRQEEWNRMEEKNKILHEIKISRLDFEIKKYKRFKSQYVTTRQLEHEKANRATYGVPAKIYWASKIPKVKRRKGRISMDKDEKKFENIAIEKHANDFFGWSYPEWDPRTTPPKIYNNRCRNLRKLKKNGSTSSKESIATEPRTHRSLPDIPTHTAKKKENVKRNVNDKKENEDDNDKDRKKNEEINDEDRKRKEEDNDRDVNVNKERTENEKSRENDSRKRNENGKESKGGNGIENRTANENRKGNENRERNENRKGNENEPGNKNRMENDNTKENENRNEIENETRKENETNNEIGNTKERENRQENENKKENKYKQESESRSENESNKENENRTKSKVNNEEDRKGNLDNDSKVNVTKDDAPETANKKADDFYDIFIES